MKSYICPNCKEKQTTVVEWQTVSVAYEYELEKFGNSKQIDTVGGEHESWACPSCGENLPTKMRGKIDKTLWG